MTESRFFPADGADLVWNVRESFRRYVDGVGGTVDYVRPATRLPDGRIRFPVRYATPEAVQYSGGVVFRAHLDALRVSIHDPRLEAVSAETGEIALSVIDAATPSQSRVVIATVDASGTVSLAGEGVGIFDFQYPAGTVLDPIEFAGP